MDLGEYLIKNSKFKGDGRYESETCLYRYFDINDELLYVGITNQPMRREETHWSKDPEWRCYAIYMTVEMFPTRKIAEIAEMNAIQREDPEFNKLRLDGCGAEHYPRNSWYLEICGGELCGEFPATYDVCDYEAREGYNGTTFWQSPVFRDKSES